MIISRPPLDIGVDPMGDGKRRRTRQRPGFALPVAVMSRATAKTGCDIAHERGFEEEKLSRRTPGEDERIEKRFKHLTVALGSNQFEGSAPGEVSVSDGRSHSGGCDHAEDALQEPETGKGEASDTTPGNEMELLDNLINNNTPVGDMQFVYIDD